MNGTNNISSRMSYDASKEMFVKAFKDKFGGDEMACRRFVNGFKLTQGEVRCEVELNATGTVYTFGVNVNQANTNNVLFNTERRLPMQDSLCATEMYIRLGNPTSRIDTAYKLFTYGNTIAFPLGAASLDSTLFSNGFFTMKVNNDVLVPYRGLDNFRYQPQTQQTAALGAASPGDQYRGVEDGGTTLEPNLVLIGSSNIIPQIELPANLAAVDEFTRAVLIFRGVYAQNSTIVN
jgi:hypothetical protein